MSEQVDTDIQSVDKRPHLHQSLDLRLLDICAILHFLIQLRFRKDCQRHYVDDAGMEFVENIGGRYRACFTVALTAESVEYEPMVMPSSFR